MAVQQKFQRKNVYKDFDLSLTRNPLTNDIGTKTDVAAINQSVKNIIQTNYYERPFQPDFGCNIRALLFEPADPITIADMRQVIFTALGNHEPRVTVTSVIIKDLKEQNSYHIEIGYDLRDANKEDVASLVLERLR
jgi:uncharacterized protein